LWPKKLHCIGRLSTINVTEMPKPAVGSLDGKFNNKSRYAMPSRVFCLTIEKTRAIPRFDTSSVQAFCIDSTPLHKKRVAAKLFVYMDQPYSAERLASIAWTLLPICHLHEKAYDVLVQSYIRAVQGMFDMSRVGNKYELKADSRALGLVLLLGKQGEFIRKGAFRLQVYPHEAASSTVLPNRTLLMAKPEFITIV
jgi:hypothetical protein